MRQSDDDMGSNSDFEMDLRRAVDRNYERETSNDNPIFRLIQGTLSREECQKLYLSQWDSIMAFNRVLLPRLLEQAPDLATRVELMQVIAQEYGPDVATAHPNLFRNFLVALGVNERDLRWETDLEHGPSRDEVEMLRAASWCELLGRILVGESLGPVVFPAVASALERSFAMSRASLRYFTLHATTDKKDAEILFRLLGNAARTASQRRAALSMIERSFSGNRYLLYGCRLPGTLGYRFTTLGAAS